MVESIKISCHGWYRLRSMRPTALARGAVDLGEFSPLSGAILKWLNKANALDGR